MTAITADVRRPSEDASYSKGRIAMGGELFLLAFGFVLTVVAMLAAPENPSTVGITRY